MVAAYVLVPSLLEVEELHWQVALVNRQAAQLDAEIEEERALLDALVLADPVVLERAAALHLHRRRSDRLALAPLTAEQVAMADAHIAQKRGESPQQWRVRSVAWRADEQRAGPQHAYRLQMVTSPGREAAEHEKQQGQDRGAGEASLLGAESRLVRLVTGPMRHGVLALAVVLLLLGLFPAREEDREVIDED